MAMDNEELIKELLKGVDFKKLTPEQVTGRDGLIQQLTRDGNNLTLQGALMSDLAAVFTSAAVDRCLAAAGVIGVRVSPRPYNAFARDASFGRFGTGCAVQYVQSLRSENTVYGCMHTHGDTAFSGYENASCAQRGKRKDRAEGRSRARGVGDGVVADVRD